MKDVEDWEILPVVLSLRGGGVVSSYKASQIIGAESVLFSCVPRRVTAVKGLSPTDLLV